MVGQRTKAVRGMRGRSRVTRVVVVPTDIRGKSAADQAGNGQHGRPGYVREVTLVYRWTKVPEWLETSRRVYGSRDAWPYFQRLENKVREHLMALYLDASNAPIAVEVVHVGRMNDTACCPGEIFRSALHLGAVAVIVAHNHPSTSPRPSLNDEQSFEGLQKAAALVGVTVLDSLVIVPGTYYSLADAKCLELSRECYRRNAPYRAAAKQAKASRAARRAAVNSPAPA